MLLSCKIPQRGSLKRVQEYFSKFKEVLNVEKDRKIIIIWSGTNPMK
ncbi:hypothetical protein HMPREF9071_0353 [Capnocytophaga sp. oral taxon 338 str. F0234]|nr:hypothetical protein HMPREF9071_0353 [Capnocytophaga sp. oral taxon 338 str. F0234]